jgi:3-methyladenine DNA glycosylase AlkD
MPTPTAEQFIERLNALQSDEELRKIQRYFKTGKDEFMGVRMGSLFALAKEFIEMAPDEIEKLLEHPIHEVRTGGCSIMDKQGRLKKTPESLRKELYDLYLRRHDRINNWDLVDLAAPYVIGRYLIDKPRDILYELAKSSDIWERRTAIVGSYYFIREDQVDDTFAISELLIQDPEDLIHKAVGGGLRWAGDHAPDRLIGFLDKHAATMPRVALRYAIEHFTPDQRAHYLGKKNVSTASDTA